MILAPGSGSSLATSQSRLGASTAALFGLVDANLFGSGTIARRDPSRQWATVRELQKLPALKVCQTLGANRIATSRIEAIPVAFDWRLALLRLRLRAVLLIYGCIISIVSATASTVPVRYREGLLNGFLVLSTLEGNAIADGDLTQVARGNEITSHLVYHFKDGSLQDETTVFSQRRDFRLIRYHLVQKGPQFQRASDLSIETSTGRVTVRYSDGDGKEKVETERLKLPPDLANGLVLTLLKNLSPDAPPFEVSMVVAMPKPRLVKLSISSHGEDPFSLGATQHKALHYVLKVEIGGVTGLIAPLFGKQPPDSHVWILAGEAPAFVKSEVLSYPGGPMWRTELIAPVWPKAASSDAKEGSAAK